MINFWGYSISETRSINYDTNDKSMTEYIARVVPSSKLCIGCGDARQDARQETSRISTSGKFRCS